MVYQVSTGWKIQFVRRRAGVPGSAGASPGLGRTGQATYHYRDDMGAYPLHRERRLVSVARAADPAVPASGPPPKDAAALLSRLGPLPPRFACDIIAQIASALDAAHARGLIHGDVKPANILLEPGDTAGEVTPQRIGGHESGRAYLSDSGMSSALPPGQIAAAGPFT